MTQNQRTMIVVIIMFMFAYFAFIRPVWVMRTNEQSFEIGDKIRVHHPTIGILIEENQPCEINNSMILEVWKKDSKSITVKVSANNPVDFVDRNFYEAQNGEILLIEKKKLFKNFRKIN